MQHRSVLLSYCQALPQQVEVAQCREGSDEEAEAGQEEEEDDESGCMTNRLVLYS